MKSTKLVLFLFLTLNILLTSCNNEEDIIKTSNQIISTYDGFEISTELINLDPFNESFEILSISNNPASKDITLSIEYIITGKSGSKIKESANLIIEEGSTSAKIKKKASFAFIGLTTIKVI